MCLCRKGEEVSISYGDWPNDVFLLFFGFLPDSNPHDSVVLFQSLHDMIAFYSLLLQQQQQEQQLHKQQQQQQQQKQQQQKQQQQAQMLMQAQMLIQAQSQGDKSQKGHEQQPTPVQAQQSASAVNTGQVAAAQPSAQPTFRSLTESSFVHSEVKSSQAGTVSAQPPSTQPDSNLQPNELGNTDLLQQHLGRDERQGSEQDDYAASGSHHSAEHSELHTGGKRIKQQVAELESRLGPGHWNRYAHTANAVRLIEGECWCLNVIGKCAQTDI